MLVFLLNMFFSLLFRRSSLSFLFSEFTAGICSLEKHIFPCLEPLKKAMEGTKDLIRLENSNFQSRKLKRKSEVCFLLSPF